MGVPAPVTADPTTPYHSAQPASPTFPICLLLWGGLAMQRGG